MPHQGATKLEQTLWDMFWVPPETEIVDRPELLMTKHPSRASLCSISRVRGEEGRTSELVAEASSFLQTPVSTASVVDTVPTAALENALAHEGYSEEIAHDARVRRITDDVGRSSTRWDVQRIEHMQQLRDCVSLQQAIFEASGTRTEAEYKLELAQCTGESTRVRRYVAYTEGGTPAACAGMTIFPMLEFGFLWAGGTHEDFRGRGAYSALVDRRLSDARELGLTHVGLYARQQTSSPIVAKQGFERCGTMVRWKRELKL